MSLSWRNDCMRVCWLVTWFTLIVNIVEVRLSNQWASLGLPQEHLSYYFYSRPDAKQRCLKDETCPYKSFLDDKKCWGYEKECLDIQYHMSQPECYGDVPYGWAKTRAEQVESFWNAADYGYVKERLNEMTVLCQPRNPGESYLACAKYTRYCKATNIVMDFTTAKLLQGHNAFREDVFKPGQIGGHCKLDSVKLQAESAHKSPLQSWYAELEHYSELDFQSLESAKCDVILDKPTILIKLDAGVNMFHHFCDYINLYASQHVNGSWSRDIHIIMWNTSPMSYGDFFHDTWKAFTDHPIIHLNSYDGKKLCIRDAVFSLLARMRYGLYYNMPLIPSCRGSSLMRSFSQHVLHRLGISQEGPVEAKIRITLLSRSSKYRRILNEAELISALKAVGRFEVNVVDYNHKYPFLKQLQVTQNSDIFIGMHGAGLTHLLFQPDWAVIFELYNCDDEHCYKDLARIRGIRYITWEDSKKLVQEDEGHHPTLGAHQKFTNYSFDADEFLRLVLDAVAYVEKHPRYLEALRQRRATSSVKEDL